MLTLILKGIIISKAGPLVLTSKESAASREAWFLFHFQNNLVLTSMVKEVSCTDTSLFRIKVSVPWLRFNLNFSVILNSSFSSVARRFG